MAPPDDTQFSIAAQLSQLSLERSSLNTVPDVQEASAYVEEVFGGSSTGGSQPDTTARDNMFEPHGRSQAAGAGQTERNPMSGPENTKSQICFDFTKGLCTRGDKCKYSHDLATIVHFNSKEKGICFDYLRNQCHRGLLCRFSHDLSNIAQQCQMIHGAAAARGRTTAICYDFVKGVCQRGNDCRYSHDLSLIARTSRGGANSMRSGEVCYDYLRGRCNRGTSCKYSHNISFLAAPGYGGDESLAGGASPPSADQMPLLVPGSALLNGALSADPSGMGVPKLMQHFVGTSPDDRRTLSSSLSAELGNDIVGHMDQPTAGLWGTNPAMASQAAMFGSLAAQQRHLAAAAGMGFPQLHPAALAQQMASAPGTAAVAAAAAAAAHQSQQMMAAKTAAAAAAAAVQQQQQAAVAMRAAIMAATQQQPGNMALAAAQQAAHAQLSMMPQNGSSMQRMGSSGGAASPALNLTPEAISALLSNLRHDNPAAMAETLSGLAAAAQAQAHQARMMGVGPHGQHSSMPQRAHSAMLHGEYQHQQGGGSGESAFSHEAYQYAQQQHPQQHSAHTSYGGAPPDAAPMMTRSASVSSGGHSSAGGAPPGINASPDLLPLIKEIWSKAE